MYCMVGARPCNRQKQVVGMPLPTHTQAPTREDQHLEHLPQQPPLNWRHAPAGSPGRKRAVPRAARSRTGRATGPRGRPRCCRPAPRRSPPTAPPPAALPARQRAPAAPPVQAAKPVTVYSLPQGLRRSARNMPWLLPRMGTPSIIDAEQDSPQPTAVNASAILVMTPPTRAGASCNTIEYSLPPKDVSTFWYAL